MIELKTEQFACYMERFSDVTHPESIFNPETQWNIWTTDIMVSLFKNLPPDKRREFIDLDIQGKMDILNQWVKSA